MDLEKSSILIFQAPSLPLYIMDGSILDYLLVSVALVCFWGLCFWTLSLSLKGGLSSYSTVFWISVGLLITYPLGELMVDHRVKFLPFWLIFSPILILPANATH
jgi:hypothetical protein